jgi:hypothetical protein
MLSRLVFALALAAIACDPAPAIPDGGTPPDAATDGGTSNAGACARCTADEICVAAYDGTCIELGVTCKPKTTACPAAACSVACAPYLCGTGADGGAGSGPSLSCATTHCPGKTPVPGAFGCYGP